MRTRAVHMTLVPAGTLVLPAMMRAQKPKSPAGRVAVADGSGKCRSIQGALNSPADSSAIPRTIFIKRGLCREE
jgi:hypothetical protein